MSKAWKIIAYLACVSMAGLAIAVYALFHGYFDRGHFEIKQFQWSSTKQVAMLAERWDDQALGGLADFVLVGNHVFTPAELRHAYYSDAVVFNAETDCLTLRWDGPNRLIIRCNGATLDFRHINAENQQVGNVAVSYENIASK
ncbi:MAG TPA: hypothetical protein VKB26_13355 [Candidatus Acidoferrales bacterium]|nr:hypothetical protein [Candidatus Acidoferrales bacterium]